MVRIVIDGSERNLSEITESWVNQNVNQRRDDGQAVCVRVIIHEKPVADFTLSSAECGVGGGRRRQLIGKEKGILDLWRKNKLDSNDFRGGNVIAFLKQLRKYI